MASEKADREVVLEQRSQLLHLADESALQSHELVRIASALQAADTDSKAVEQAIGQAFKLLQAQVLSKAGRSELHESLASTLDASLDSQVSTILIRPAFCKYMSTLPACSNASAQEPLETFHKCEPYLVSYAALHCEGLPSGVPSY